MTDDRIKKLRVSKEYLATHIANKKKKIKKVVSGEKLDRGAMKRTKILENLANSDSYSNEDEETSLNQEDLPKVNNKRKTDIVDGESGDETILSRRYNNKKRRWEWETHNEDEILWEPKESFINEHGEEMDEFKAFEESHPYEENETNTDSGVLTQGSMHIFNHTRKLASAQVPFYIIAIFSHDRFHRLISNHHRTCSTFHGKSKQRQRKKLGVLALLKRRKRKMNWLIT